MSSILICSEIWHHFPKRPGVAMNSGQMIFAQVMDVMSLKTFHRCVQLYQGDFSVKHFNCLEQFRVMAFAQLTYRESLRDTVTCLQSQSRKLYRMGIRSRISKSTLADVNEIRDWHIYADFAQHLIGVARKLYQKDQLAIDIEQTVYALDSTTIDLCVSVFPHIPPTARPVTRRRFIATGSLVSRGIHLYFPLSRVTPQPFVDVLRFIFKFSFYFLSTSILFVMKLYGERIMKYTVFGSFAIKAAMVPLSVTRIISRLFSTRAIIFISVF
jgi:hypothetical protein